MGRTDEGHGQLRGAAAGLERLQADGLLELRGRGPDHGHGRGPGEGRDVVRQRVGLLPARDGPDPNRGRHDASGRLSEPFSLYRWPTNPLCKIARWATPIFM